MGQALKHPITSKLVQLRSDVDWGVRMVAVNMQGYRRSMEDTVVLHVDERVVIAGVFDGHGGVQVAEVCRDHLPLAISTLPTIDRDSLVQACIEFNKQHFSSGFAGVGSTALMLVVTKPSLFIVHLGDSRAFLSEAGSNRLLTVPHDPVREADRIRAAGFPIRNSRIADDLAVARAFGDMEYAPAVIAEPEVWEWARDGTPRLFALMSDGLVEGTTDEALTQRLNDLDPTTPLESSAISLCQNALLHSKDNCSVVLVETGSEVTLSNSVTYGLIDPMRKKSMKSYQEAYQMDLQRYPV